MQRATLYSRAGRRKTVVADAPPGPDAADRQPPSPPPPPAESRLRRFSRTYRTPLAALAVVLAVFSGAALDRQLRDTPPIVTQRVIDRAVRVSLEKNPLPSKAAKAYEAIGPSVVRVVGFDHPDPHGTQPKDKAEKGKKQENKRADKATPKTPDKSAAPKPETSPPDTDDDSEDISIGSGVIITESGAILTNLHVVSGASRLQVIFADGSESDATITGADPSNDLAVLQAARLPDDLQPATLITTGDLRPGDEVVAVGFPFGFGPSVSSGVVSGLKREFHSTDGQRVLSNLIQFDAAANPGNSGGPLVNTEGEVVGIVTAILNPTPDRFFVGLGFAVPIENAASAVGLSPF
jgi:S1-C subfamily serine protease